MKEFDHSELPLHIKNHILDMAGAMGVQAKYIDPAPFMNIEPQKTQFDHMMAANQETAAARTAKRMEAEANRKPGDGLPTAAEAKRIAERLQVDVRHIRTREMAEAEDAAERQKAEAATGDIELRQAIKSRDVVKLVDIGNDKSSPGRTIARAAMAEILPSFDSWND